MEFNEKLQELRKKKGITQEELAKNLYVSRTAISKWESGRGYPNIESLKAIAKFFSVTVDQLISYDQALTIAEQQNKVTKKGFCDLVFGLLDVFMSVFVFLPLFAERVGDAVQSVSLVSLRDFNVYLKVIYIVFIALTCASGILTLALQNCRAVAWLKSKTINSLALGIILVLRFLIGLQPYAGVFAFVLLAIKVFVLIKAK